MDDYGNPMNLSTFPNTSENQYYDQTNLMINDAASVPWPFPHQTPPYSSTGHRDNNLDDLAPKKRRGRPHGSKNKPKPPTVITENSDELMKLVTIEVSIGSDIVEALVKFAHLSNVDISILSGSGSTSNAILHNPFPNSPYFTLNGLFTLVSLTGSYISSLSNSHHQSYPLIVTPASSSSSALIPNTHPYSGTVNSIGISVFGSQGEIIGGVVAGKVVAASTVTIIATVFKKPEFYKVGEFNEIHEVHNNGGEDNYNCNASGNDSMITSLMNSNVGYGNVNMIQ